MASRKAQIQIQTTADTSGAQAAAKAMQQVDTASTQAAGGASKVGQTAAQAGFQLQDFAVQVGGGTSALTAFAQQAPQLLGIFGPGGAIAGALVAVGAVATKIFMGMGDDAQSASEKAEELADVVEKVAQAQNRILQEDFDFGARQIELSVEQASALREALNLVRDAEAEYSRNSIKNAETLRQTLEQIAILQGKQVDQFKSANEAFAAQQQQQAEAAQKAIDAQQQQVEEAKAQAAEQQRLLQAAIAQRESLQQDLDGQRQKVELLRQQRDEMEKAAKVGPAQAFPVFGPGGSAAMQQERAQAARAEQARQDLPAIQNQLQLTESRISKLEEMLNTFSGAASERVERAAAAAEAAQINLEATSAAVETNIAGIVEAFQVDSLKQSAQAAADTAKQQAEEIQTIVEAIKNPTETQKANIAVLTQAAADGVIVAEEQSRVAANLNALLYTLRGDQQANRTLLEQLIRSTAENTRAINELSRRGAALDVQSRNAALPIR